MADRRQELIELSGQVINGMMSADSSFLNKLYDRTLRKYVADVAVEIAEKMLEKIDSK